MKESARWIVWIFGLALFLQGLSIYASKIDSLSMESHIRTGVLKNGLKYYIKPIPDAEHVALKLLIHAGTYQEEEDQAFMAHFMEHMVLKAGRNVSLTMRYTSELFSEAGINPKRINAITGNDYTKFSASVPNNTKAIQTMFLLFKDILWGLDFKQEYIDSERSPFIGEHETKGSGLSTSYLDAMIENGITGCGGRFPSDYNTYIWSIKREPLLRYYRQWYRPENASLIIVGNVQEVDSLEEKVRGMFSLEHVLERPSVPENCQESYQQSPPKFIHKEGADKGSETSVAQMYCHLYMRNLEYGRLDTQKKLQQKWDRDLVAQVLNMHLKRSAQSYNVNFFARARFRNFGALHIRIGMKNGGLKSTLQSIMGTVKELRQNGVTAKSFLRAKTLLFNEVSKIDRESLRYWEQELTNHALEGEMIVEDKIASQEAYLSQLSLPQFNAILRKYVKEMPEDIALLVPKGHDAINYSESVIRGWIRETKTGRHQNMTSSDKHTLLGVEDKENLRIGPINNIGTAIPNARFFQLTNGVKILLKSGPVSPSVYGDHQSIRIRGFVPKGAKCYPESDFYNAINAPQIIDNSGVGGLDKFELKNQLKALGYTGRIHPYIRPYESGINVTTPLEDLETAFQLIYLYFTAPNKNLIAFEDWQTNALANSASRVNQFYFMDSIKEVLEDPYYVPRGIKSMDGIVHADFERAFRIYSNLFGNAADYTFLLTGHYDEEKVLKLCRKYLGNLPNRQTLAESCSDIPERYQEHRAAKEHTFMAKEKSEYVRLNLTYLYPLKKDFLGWRDEIKLNVLYTLLDYALMHRLRFASEQGGPYSIGVGRYDFNAPLNRMEVSISFSCRPEDKARLLHEMQEVLNNLQTTSIPQELFDTAVNSHFPSADMPTNMELQKQIYDHVKYGRPWVGISEKREYLRNLTLQEIMEFANTLLGRQPYMFILEPNS